MYIAYPDHLKDIKISFKDAIFFEVLVGDPYSLKKVERDSEQFKEKRIVLRYVSDVEKIIIDYRFDFFHCIIDILGTILYEYKKNNNLLFLINLSHVPASFFCNTYNIFFFDTLNKLGINHKIVSLKHNELIEVSNFTYYKNPPMTYDSLSAIEDSAKDLYSAETPSKKVYLSRKKMTDVKPDSRIFGNQPKDKFLFDDDNRIDNEEIMEEFFSSIGFEIVYPEDFSSFNDQVRYFSNVKMLAGVTGAGMVNSIFMPKGGTILEMTTPLIVLGRESVHNFYKEIAFVKNHKYISITNFRRSEEILSFINQDLRLKDLLSE